MRKEILAHFGSVGIFLVAFILLEKVFLPYGWNVLPKIGVVLLGGLLGTILPDIDHLIYVYLLHPQELTSQRVNYVLVSQTQAPSLRVRQAFDLLARTRSERTQLIFHTATFQVIFWILTFLVISSSGSLFGKALVLAFSLHLIVDQFIDLSALDTLDIWFRTWGVALEKEKYLFYLLGNLTLLFLFAFVL